ncbi:MAG TPA: ATP-binding protein [Gemmataceae bacterium]|nr:ATP-binding protein [Gemmataceae bacterium]
MSLTTRMSAFLLGVLAVVLAGFSTTLYLLARTYLHRQVEERLTTALDTLVAAAEMEPDGIDWEPNVHHLTLGQDGAADQVRWFVRDGEGRVVDRSANLGADDPLTEDSPAWRVLERRLESGPSAVPPKHGALVLTGGVSLEPVRGTLLRLAATLAGLSVGLWLLAALVGRWVARKALAPVTRMAKAARAMTPDDPRQRLPCPGTHDELDDLQRAFNDLLCRLHEALERQRRFTGDASHQLRTPLTAMLGQVEVALRRGRPPEEYREALARVQAQADHLRQIVEALLFLARADAEARLDGLAVADVAEALPTVAARWSGHPRTADLRTEIIGDGPFLAQVQPLLLGQLFDNLIDNAFKHSAAGTPVVLRLRQEKGAVALDVEDGGHGIAGEDLPHVFEPFYRSAESRRLGLPGVGLGLAMVQRIAAALGGSVVVKSNEGAGSRFTLCLPALAGQPR